MSNKTNSQLYDRAAEMIAYWEGTVMAEVMEADLDRDDLETLHYHVCKAEAMASQEEFAAHDIN